MLSRIAGKLTQIPEHRYRLGRWLALTGWLLLIGLLLYDPISPALSARFPDYASLHGEHVLTDCVPYQSSCIDRPEVYFLGPPIFWGLVVPLSVATLLVFGHEVWRRICPLSLMSQLPALLGWQRRNANSGKAPLVSPRSWLGRNYFWLQLGLLFLGLCMRLWLIDSNRVGLAVWLLLTLAAALLVGSLFGGKTWCNYICPMAPVQRVYSMPGGILTSRAAWGYLPQSMCRTTAEEIVQEKSACVGCQKGCIDIDSERSYWDQVDGDHEKFLRYGYLGLIIGFFGYYYLCAGNWEYFFSGLWIQQEAHMMSLWDPGFYLWGHAIPIPKLFAVPLTLASAMLLTWRLGIRAEQRYRLEKQRQGERFSPKALQHRFFALTTFLAFNLFFIFAGRSWVLLLPPAFQYFYHTLIVLASGIWFYRNWQRTPEGYLRNSTAGRIQRGLEKSFPELLTHTELNSLEDLNADELHVLSRVLPVLNQTQRQQLYREILLQLHQYNEADGALGQLLAQDLQAQLGITAEEHQQAVAQLGCEDNRHQRRAALMRAIAALSPSSPPQSFPAES